MSASNTQRALINMRSARRDIHRPRGLSPVPYTPPRDRTKKPRRRKPPYPLQDPTTPTRRLFDPRPNEPYLVDDTRPRLTNFSREETIQYYQDLREVRVGCPGQAVYRPKSDFDLDGMRSRKRRACSAEIDLVTPREEPMVSVTQLAPSLASIPVI
jgi:hypothetical protein